MNSAKQKLPDRSRLAWLRNGLAALGLVNLVALAKLTYDYSANSATSDESSIQATILSWTLLGLLAVVTALSVVISRRRLSSVWLVVASLAAFAAVLLGMVAYVPCTGGQIPFVAPMTWTLELFVGGVEQSAIGLGSQTCDVLIPPGFQVARLLALTVVLLGAVSAVVLLWHEQIKWWRVKFTSDLDVVVGLTKESLPLVRALLVQANQPREKDWCDLSRMERTRRKLRFRRLVVVIDEDPRNSLIAEAENAGAISLIADATDDRVVKAICWRRWGLRQRTTLRRMYAVTKKHDINNEIWQKCKVALAQTKYGHRENVIPSLFVRIDDSRTALLWRVEHLNHDSSISRQPFFSDAISSEVRLSIALVDEFLESGTGRLIVVGDGEMWIPLLDELCWRRWCEWELNRWAESGEDGDRETDRKHFDFPIDVVSDSARRQKADWERLKGPWKSILDVEGHLLGELAGPSELQVTPRDGVDEDLVVRIVEEQGSGRTTVLFLDPLALGVGAPARLARLGPDVDVLVPSDTVVGVERGPSVGMGTSSAPIEYGQGLVMPGEVHSGDMEDFWTRLARQNHMAFLARSNKPKPREHWEHATPQKVTARCWDARPIDGSNQLPEFFKQDNIRQQREIIGWFDQHGWTWEFSSEFVVPTLSEDEEFALGVAEKRRWDDLRLAEGWKRGERDDWKRTHDLINMLELGKFESQQGGASSDSEKVRQSATDELKKYDIPGNRFVFHRLAAMGIAARRSLGRYRRLGEVTAQQLAEPWEWVNGSGNKLRANQGDFRVTDIDGSNERSVAASAFSATYTLVEGDRYRRVGQVSARRALAGETVRTLEGDAVAADGDWLVRDDSGNEWFVPGEVFARGYAEI